VAQGLISRAIFLFLKLNEFFPVSRLFISTTNDPIYTVPFDEWLNLEAYEVMPDFFVGVGGVKHHPNWHVVVKLNEDGLLT
jgi:hypothetical protein